MSWRRKGSGRDIYFIIDGDNAELVDALVHKTNACGTTAIELSILTDPRTNKPWRSMKAAREWYNEVTK
jgi:hypothetical protein